MTRKKSLFIVQRPDGDPDGITIISGTVLSISPGAVTIGNPVYHTGSRQWKNASLRFRYSSEKLSRMKLAPGATVIGLVRTGEALARFFRDADADRLDFEAEGLQLRYTGEFSLSGRDDKPKDYLDVVCGTVYSERTGVKDGLGWHRFSVGFTSNGTRKQREFVEFSNKGEIPAAKGDKVVVVARYAASGAQKAAVVRIL